MTPDTLALARAIGKLPGAPTFRVMDRYLRVDDDRLLDTGGIMWILDPDQRRWILDVEHAATGGAMLARMGADHGVICTAEGWSVCNHRDPRAQVYIGPTLGIALARLIIARGGWNV